MVQVFILLTLTTFAGPKVTQKPEYTQNQGLIMVVCMRMSKSVICLPLPALQCTIAYFTYSSTLTLLTSSRPCSA